VTATKLPLEGKKIGILVENKSYRKKSTHIRRYLVFLGAPNRVHLPPLVRRLQAGFDYLL
jgi:hypothetical protein